MEETGVYKLKTDTAETQPLSQDEITDAAIDSSTNSNLPHLTTIDSSSNSNQPHLTTMQSADNSLVITNQPRPSNRKVADSSFHSPFNDANSERDWATKLCLQKTEQRSSVSQCCCWPAHRYSLAIRLGETPFMPLIPCAVFALRVKIRTLFGIKGSLMKDFFTAMCCEPCAICQMTREMDEIGL